MRREIEVKFDESYFEDFRGRRVEIDSHRALLVPLSDYRILHAALYDARKAHDETNKEFKELKEIDEEIRELLEATRVDLQEAKAALAETKNKLELAKILNAGHVKRITEMQEACSPRLNLFWNDRLVNEEALHLETKKKLAKCQALLRVKKDAEPVKQCATCRDMDNPACSPTCGIGDGGHTWCDKWKEK